MKLQDYSSKPSIKGVGLIDLTHHFDDGGEFMEIARFKLAGDINGDWFIETDYAESEEFQVNYSVIQPGVVKGFHLHKEQTDVWFIPPNQRMLIGLIDNRSNNLKGLPLSFDHDHYLSREPNMRIIMGIKPQLLVIPPNVAHGIKNLDSRAGHMIYLTDRYFNPNDEFRIDWDILGRDFWSSSNG